ncbi:MAG: Cdc6/Cdc18 family protein [Candidatus Hodarchaeales archaeon]|jgi:cell division control protein 6
MSNTNGNFSSYFGNLRSVFREDGDGERVFNPNYIPKLLKHREEEVKSLINFFRSIVTNPTTSSRKVVLYGPVGTGKTVVSKTFGIEIANHLKARRTLGDPLFRYFHINCRKMKTPHQILTTCLRYLVPGFPLRGYSVDELFRMFSLYLGEQNLVVLLALDEVDYLLASPEGERTDFLYALSRIEESMPLRENPTSNYQEPNNESRFNLLLITRNKNFRHYLDTSTASSLGRNFIYFSPYTRHQLFDIIYDRAEAGLQQDSYNDELLDTIASIAEEYGDSRFAIELLWKAGKIADKLEQRRISPEHIRKAVISVLPLEKSFIEDLNTHQKIILLSMAKLLRNTQNTFITTPEITSSYNRTCEEAGVKPRRSTQVWAYLKDLARLGVIQKETTNRHKQGRSFGRISKYRIQDLPIEEIFSSLNPLIEDQSQ